MCGPSRMEGSHNLICLWMSVLWLSSQNQLGGSEEAPCSQEASGTKEKGKKNFVILRIPLTYVIQFIAVVLLGTATVMCMHLLWTLRMMISQHWDCPPHPDGTLMRMHWGASSHITELVLHTLRSIYQGACSCKANCFDHWAYASTKSHRSHEDLIRWGSNRLPWARLDPNNMYYTSIYWIENNCVPLNSHRAHIRFWQLRFDTLWCSHPNATGWMNSSSHRFLVLSRIW